jgi:hypothetical protein
MFQESISTVTCRRPDLHRFAVAGGHDEQNSFQMEYEKDLFLPCGADGWQLANSNILGLPRTKLL